VLPEVFPGKGRTLARLARGKGGRKGGPRSTTGFFVLAHKQKEKKKRKRSGDPYRHRGGSPNGSADMGKEGKKNRAEMTSVAANTVRAGFSPRKGKKKCRPRRARLQGGTSVRHVASRRGEKREKKESGDGGLPCPFPSGWEPEEGTKNDNSPSIAPP